MTARFDDTTAMDPRTFRRRVVVASAGGRSRAAFHSSCRVELVEASLCRSELLIEIEGLATPEGRLDMSCFGPVDES